MTLRNLPRVDRLLAHPEMVGLNAPRRLALAAAREAIAEARAWVKEGGAVDAEAVAARAVGLLRGKLRPSLGRCVNATGVVLHTGLGRAPLSAAAAQALAEVAAGYANVQSDVGSGERMPREVHVESILQELTGAEAAAVVNNNAAATVLVLNTFAAGREVIISRGEMVEIGGAFRLPDIVRLSGCRLVEVGCTNRTHLRDYRRAVTPETALLLPVHQSNFRITGFTAAPDVADLVALAREHGIACAHDLGSGAMHDFARFGLPHEPTVQESLAAGVDAVFFSGDKLLGGPQCGVILGKRAAIEAMRANPFYRTFRVDKLILAALEVTLRLFLAPETIREQHRVTELLTRPESAVRAQVEALAEEVRGRCAGLTVSVERVASQVGGGSLAGQELPSWALRVCSRAMSAEEVASRLRLNDPPIFARVHEGAVLLDGRAVLAGEDPVISAALARLFPTGQEA